MVGTGLAPIMVIVANISTVSPQATSSIRQAVKLRSRSR